jgi:hypothetical protein
VNLEGPARRIALATAATVALFALALGLAIWRYEVAIDRYQFAVLREDGANAGRDAIASACGCRISPAPPPGFRTRHKMSRSKAFGKGSETNQSPRNGPL